MSQNIAKAQQPLHINLTAYDDVEQLHRFNEQEFANYCDSKLQACAKHVHFIRSHCHINADWQGKICEVGSGNSRLLYRLEREGLLSDGLGIEISESRHAFAEAFKDYSGCTKVTNINANIFDMTPPTQCDLVLGVDVAVQLITPVSPNAEKDLFSWLRQAVKPGGYLILEMWDLEEMLQQVALAHGNYQYWKEFPSADPFEFILMQVQQDKLGDLVWNKTFIKRNSDERPQFSNSLRPYTKQKIITLLKMYGFTSVEIFDYWTTDGDTNDATEYIVLAQ